MARCACQSGRCSESRGRGANAWQQPKTARNQIRSTPGFQLEATETLVCSRSLPAQISAGHDDHRRATHVAGAAARPVPNGHSPGANGERRDTSGAEPNSGRAEAPPSDRAPSDDDGPSSSRSHQSRLARQSAAVRHIPPEAAVAPRRPARRSRNHNRSTAHWQERPHSRR